MLITVLLPLTFPPGAGPTGFDRAVDSWVHTTFDAHPAVLRILVTPSDAYVIVPVMLLGALWYAWRRDWWRAGFLLVAPELVVALNTFALKYVWHRHLHHYLAYPSGHTVQFVAIATGFVLVAPTARVRAAEFAVAAVLLVAIAIGMIGFGYHYPTDIVGGAAIAVALTTALYAAFSPGRTARTPRLRTTAATRPR
ncbi:phosphatase PAP2 family protein [Nocardia sp. NEAU-G5]|uniref:Phosphatase PAP2 family protein n=1 Tax=Nocardia albiluteola TaxID=2842303 RepID=A0ABS6AV19_9NOCA|nr:phosphatase PAP2 family protein [Nocardia albiluteola]